MALVTFETIDSKDSDLGLPFIEVSDYPTDRQGAVDINNWGISYSRIYTVPHSQLMAFMRSMTGHRLARTTEHIWTCQIKLPHSIIIHNPDCLGRLGTEQGNSPDNRIIWYPLYAQSIATQPFEQPRGPRTTVWAQHWTHDNAFKSEPLLGEETFTYAPGVPEEGSTPAIPEGPAVPNDPEILNDFERFAVNVTQPVRHVVTVQYGPLNIINETIQYDESGINVPQEGLFWDPELTTRVVRGQGSRYLPLYMGKYQIQCRLPMPIPTRTVGGAEVHYSYMFGKINSKIFTSKKYNMTFPIGTLMYEAPMIQDVTPMHGQPMFIHTYRFSFNAVGWNRAVRPSEHAGGQYDSIQWSSQYNSQGREYVQHESVDFDYEQSLLEDLSDDFLSAMW